MYCIYIFNGHYVCIAGIITHRHSDGERESERTMGRRLQHQQMRQRSEWRRAGTLLMGRHSHFSGRGIGSPTEARGNHCLVMCATSNTQTPHLAAPRKHATEREFQLNNNNEVPDMCCSPNKTGHLEIYVYTIDTFVGRKATRRGF